MQKILRYVLDKTQITVTTLILIILMGTYSYIKMSKTEDPKFTFRFAQVKTFFPGASPERVENLVTSPIEKVIQEIPQVSIVESESRTGLSVIRVEVREGIKNLQPIWDLLRRKIEKVSQDLPEGVSRPIVNDEFGDVFGTVITITGEDYALRDLKEMADDLRDKLINLEEVSKVQILGAQDEAIYIEYNEARLAESGISTLQLQEFMKSRNIVISGGAIVNDLERIYLEPSGKYTSVEEIANTPFVNPKTGQVIYLKDVTEVKRGYKEPSMDIVYSSGKQALAIGISLREDANIFAFGDHLNQLINDTLQELPLGIEIDTLIYQPSAVSTRVNHFIRDLIASIIIIIIFIVFTLGYRSSIILSSMIPMTILLTFILMKFLDVSINHVSLSALIISLGMIVDNGIVITESIITLVQEGWVKKQATLESCREYSQPLWNSTLTTIAAFLPIYLAKSDAGEYTSALFIVVSLSLICSWFLSLTMIPFLCLYFLKIEHNEHNKKIGLSYELYRKALVKILKRPYQFTIFVILLLILSFIPLKAVRKIFFPPSEKLLIEASFLLPVGTKIEKTEEINNAINQFITNELLENKETGREGVTNWISFIGGNTPRYVVTYLNKDVGPEVLQIFINISSKEVRPIIIEKMATFINDHYPQATASLKLPQQGPPVEAPIVIRISGPDINELLSIASTVKTHLKTDALYSNFRDNWGNKTKKIVLKIDQIKAQRAGLTSLDVATSLQTSLTGFTFTNFNEIDKNIPVIVRGTQDPITDLNKLETLTIRSQQTNKTVPLKQIADMEVIWQPNVIVRRNLVKSIYILSEIKGDHITPIEATEKLIPWLEQQKKTWPKGYTFDMGGEMGESTKSAKSISDNLMFTFVLVLLILCMEFNSIKIAIIILLTIPLGVIGVFFGLYLTNAEMGFMTYLGILSLSGIVLNHSIVLLDRILIEKSMGKSDQDSIVDAAVRRLRPIVLTASILIVGLVPLLFDRSSMFYSMGVSLIFGMIFATVLTLGLIPVLYSIFYHIKFDESYPE